MIIPEDLSPQRATLVRRLHEDLVGPRAEDETLESRPTDVYLTGILWPQRTRLSGEEDERLSVGSSRDTEAADAEEEEVPAASVQKPSVAGLSFCAHGEGDPRVSISCSFGRYDLENEDGNPRWKRRQIRVTVPDLELRQDAWFIELAELNADAAGVRLHIRAVDGPEGRLTTLTLVNAIAADEGRDAHEAACLFQTEVAVEPSTVSLLVPRPTRRIVSDNADPDDRSSALLFRNVVEFAAGHTCSAIWTRPETSERPHVNRIETTWIPDSTVPGIDSRGHQVFRHLSDGAADALGALALAHADPEELHTSLRQLTDAYDTWIRLQEAKLETLAGSFRTVAEENLIQCREVHRRMEDAAGLISTDQNLRHAFQLANLAMHIQHQWDPEKAEKGPLRWRPFQLAFLLLSAVSTARRSDNHRRTMDLLWFPTGGGKTEAYLALVAMLAFYRRLSPDAPDHKGVAAVMRYTLRLLTTQQFARAAAMILACELIRRNAADVPPGPALKGEAPFSIGLWVGSDATPNKLEESYASLRGAGDVSSPKQLADCPSCHNRLVWAQRMRASPVTVTCETDGCPLKGELPVWTVDEDVYRECPTLLIGTIDKFAQVVRRKEVNRLFAVAEGSPPDLIIQDELHLISGPLGTLAGLYESAIDLMFSARGWPPKVIGSTATIRRATEQVRDLFNRSACQFPPPAIDHDDSGFAVIDPEAMGRRYIGVSTAGRSAKFTLQAVAASLLQSAAVAFATDSERDPYWTLLGYFNSLRELGGALILMQDDVADTIRLLATARDEDERPSGHVEELTSRRTQEEIVGMLKQLAIKAGQAGVLDTVLATNMVSVGVDIPRLGLMVVNGQPKSTSEYIQSTSRVGRGDIAGLVVTLLNNAKARDRSHFETFAGWHQALYRDVEATSVTPFASRARDRALHAALVAAVRHLVPGMLVSPAGISAHQQKIDELIDLIVDRAKVIDRREIDVEDELHRRVQIWEARHPEEYWHEFKPGKSLLQSAERAAARRALGYTPGEAWPTMNNMRSVEAGTPFRLAPKLGEGGSNRGE